MSGECETLRPFYFAQVRVAWQLRIGSSFVPDHNLDSIKQRDQTRMDPVLPPSINDALPNEILATVFEEHELEWNAPAVDGRVCRLWRELVLITPRAWSYLHISRCEFGQLSVAK